jgi:predicted phosphodiesterase
MKRRSFFRKTTAAIMGLGLTTSSKANTSHKGDKKAFNVCATLDQNKVFFYSEVINESIKVVHIADTHLFKDDARGIPYQEYSNRMAKAYNKTTHFQTRIKTNPEEAFEQALAFAKEVNADVITLIGDIFSFPSEAAIEWVQSKLKDTGIPYIYTAGNHDWHYEGMEGTLESLRDTWIEKRLLPFYQGNHPLMAAYDIKGIRFLAIDNSTYQINEEQLAFFIEQVASEVPLVLLVHIPMYAPGKDIYFGCGNPNWGADTDHGFKLERRPKWPESGHTQTTLNFHKEVFNAPNLLGIFAGHTHRNSIEVIKGKPQIVSDDNASGGYLDIDFLPMEEKDRKLIGSN